MRRDGMLWGATLRSPHPRARIVSLDTAPALALEGVRAVLTHEDIPGRKTYGLEIADQPVLASRDIRYQGEALAVVAADHPETARRAAAAIAVEYEVLEPLGDAERAMAPDAPPLHEGGNLLRTVVIEHGDPDARGRGRDRGQLRGRHAGPGVPRPRVRARRPGRGRRRRPVHRHPVAARRPRPGRREPRTASREGAARARRGRRRVRRARGRVDADPRVHARAAHRSAGEDGLRPRGVVPRPRPPPSVPDGVRARRPRRRPARVRARADRARRRGLRVQLHRGVLERGVLRGRTVRGAERLADRARRLHEQPAVRRDARVRRRAGRVRLRGADGPARRGARHGSGRAADPQRDGARRPPADRPGGAGARAGGRAARARAGVPAAARRPTARPTSASSPAASPTPRTARACAAASGSRSHSRTSATPRASTTTRPRACG